MRVILRSDLSLSLLGWGFEYCNSTQSSRRKKKMNSNALLPQPTRAREREKKKKRETEFLERESEGLIVYRCESECSE